MDVSLSDLVDIFDCLIGESMTREEVSIWAEERMNAEDDGLLTYHPENKEEIIWDGITYLAGCDSKLSKDSYLNSKEDFILEKQRLIGAANQ